MVIGASRTSERAPRRLRHRYLRHSLLPENPSGPAPHPTLAALSHPPTRRTMRRRRFTRVALFVLVRPAVLAVQIAEVVADEGHDRIGPLLLGLILQVTLLHLHLCVIVTARSS